MKRVLSVQDLSCVGKCSLTLALPVVSAMGVSCSVLPTAVLSTHTGFPDPYVRDLTGDIAPVGQHLSSVGAQFDGICVGYLSSPRQAREVGLLADRFPAPLILDPAMGDHGRLYSGITGEHVEAVKDLCPRAAVLLPNVTEAAFLTGLSPDADPNILLDAVMALGPKACVLTGVSLQPGMTGFLGADQNSRFSYQTEALPGAFHGTGDLFAAVLTGALMKEKTLEQSARLAAAFVERCIRNATPSPFGLSFEAHLPWLWEQL